MMNHKALLAGAMFASLAGLALPSRADIYTDAYYPAQRAEHFEVRAGYVVVPGVWVRHHGKQEWIAGHYVTARQGYHYERDRGVQHANSEWTMVRGGWLLDTDGDEVPDRTDNHPNDSRMR
jgi:hypothetical protein